MFSGYQKIEEFKNLKKWTKFWQIREQYYQREILTDEIIHILNFLENLLDIKEKFRWIYLLIKRDKVKGDQYWIKIPNISKKYKWIIINLLDYKVDYEFKDNSLYFYFN